MLTEPLPGGDQRSGKEAFPDTIFTFNQSLLAQAGKTKRRRNPPPTLFSHHPHITKRMAVSFYFSFQFEQQTEESSKLRRDSSNRQCWRHWARREGLPGGGRAPGRWEAARGSREGGEQRARAGAGLRRARLSGRAGAQGRLPRAAGRRRQFLRVPLRGLAVHCWPPAGLPDALRQRFRPAGQKKEDTAGRRQNELGNLERLQSSLHEYL